MNSLNHHPDWTLPDYAGGSILNLAASLAGHFGVRVPHAALRQALPLEGIENVVLLIVDGLGQWQLDQHVMNGDAPNLQRLMRGDAQVITSVFPSTTMAAITCIHMATPPASSGWLGYTMWLEESQTLTEMIGQVDMNSKKPIADKDFLAAVPSIYSQYAAAGVNVYAVQPQMYRGSWLNDWYWRGAAQLGYVTANTLASATMPALEVEGKKLVVLYWADYDSVCHQHGPSSAAASDEIAAVDSAIGRLLARLPKDGKTALIVTADHGQIDLQPDQAVYLERDAWLVDRLRGPPAGDRLCRTFRVTRELQAVRDHLSRYGDVLTGSEAWDAGLFGGAPASDTFRSRVGDLIVLPHTGSQLCWTFSGKQPSRAHRGSHGGLSHSQMRVPLLTVRV